VQGQLRKQALSFTIETECGHCGEQIILEMDSRLNYRVLQDDAIPVIYAPMLDAKKLDDPSIIDGF
jgi:hypothetical protein